MAESTLKPCRFCDGKPRLINCGDFKQYFVYECSVCFKTQVRYDEARITEWGARKIWNRRAND